jgi:hypothetical protein
MRRGLALAGAMGIAICLSSAGLRAEQPGLQNAPCAAVAKDLHGQIETIKLLKDKASDGLPQFSRAGKGAKSEDPQTVLVRARQQAEALNQMLPGLGCERIDIDYEMTQPLNRALLPPHSAKTKKHRPR